MSKRRWLHPPGAVLLLGTTSLLASATAALGDASHDYPTLARVEYVQECMQQHGSEAANLYKCACAIDRIAEKLSYDDYEEAATFARYAGLAGERGSIFRDPEGAKEKAKLYRTVEAEAYAACGIPARKGAAR